MQNRLEQLAAPTLRDQLGKLFRDPSLPPPLSRNGESRASLNLELARFLLQSQEYIPERTFASSLSSSRLSM